MSEQQEPYKGELVEQKDPGKLIALALEKNADPGTLEKLLVLQERWEAGNARKAYVQAMTGFKQEAPAVLIKGDKVDFSTAKGRTHYNYANLGSIVQEITVILGRFNLSASWETHQTEKDDVVVTCHITHAEGHRESVTLRGPADDSGNKNRIQAVGSTVTYLQRYTLLAALGLATGEDDDGRGGKPNVSPKETIVPSTGEVLPVPPPKTAQDRPKDSPIDGGLQGALEAALKELADLTGGFPADLIHYNSKFKDKDGKEHWVTSISELMGKSEKWAKSTLARIRADIQQEKEEQSKKGNNGEDIPF
jgi:hypothetical protein